MLVFFVLMAAASGPSVCLSGLAPGPALQGLAGIAAGRGLGAAPPPAVGEPVLAGSTAAGAGRAARSIYEGRIGKIELALPYGSGDLQGIVTVEGIAGTSRSFLVGKYTLILLVSPNGGAYAAALRQLEPGWKCSVGYDVPDQDWDNDQDKVTAAAPLKYADNMVVYYKR